MIRPTTSTLRGSWDPLRIERIDSGFEGFQYDWDTLDLFQYRDIRGLPENSQEEYPWDGFAVQKAELKSP